MSWEEKLAALQALTDTCLQMRRPGEWYVSARYRAIGGNGVLSGTYGEGLSPSQAVENDWLLIVEHLAPGLFIVIEAPDAPRRHFRWAGFMWKELPVEKRAAP